MKKSLRSALLLVTLCVVVSASVVTLTALQLAPRAALPTPTEAAEIARPQYRLNARVDFAKRTLSSTATVAAPIKNGDSVRDAVFFLYANANGVGSATPSAPNLRVESVTQSSKPLKWTQKGAVLHVNFTAPQTQQFQVVIKYRGVVPVAPPQAEGLGGMLGGMDLGEIFGGLMGGGSSSSTRKDENTDYGLFTKSGDILSLGSWWYPVLAVRKDGKWQDKAPAGLGDVVYAEAGDFRVTLHTPTSQKLVVATSGEKALVKQSANRTSDTHIFRADNVRDFAVLMSNKYQTKEKTFDVGGKPVVVTAFTTPQNAKKNDEAIEVAGRALQIFSKRFGAYPNTYFTVAEAPLRGGAGGIEYSNMTGIASMLYGDLGKQIDDLVGMLGGNSQMLGGMIDEQKAILNSMFEMTIAHEVAHQWWAMGVGSDSQSQPWVDESLTNYTATIYFEDRYGAAKAQQMRDAHLKSAFTTARMIGIPDAPVRGASSGFKNNLQYGAIVYGKGAMFYDALRKLVGDDVFFPSLREYYNRYNGKNANENSLKNIIIAKAPARKSAIENLYRRWIDETHGDEDLGRASLFGGALSGAEQRDAGDFGDMQSALNALQAS